MESRGDRGRNQPGSRGPARRDGGARGGVSRGQSSSRGSSAGRDAHASDRPSSDGRGSDGRPGSDRRSSDGRSGSDRGRSRGPDERGSRSGGRDQRGSRPAGRDGRGSGSGRRTAYTGRGAAPRPGYIPNSGIEEAPERDEWVDDGPVSSGSGQRRPDRPRRSARGEAARSARLTIAPEAFGQAVSPRRAERLARRVGDAAVAFEAERFEEARSILGPIAREAPDTPEVRELLGLTYYRLGRWRDSVRELEAFGSLTASNEQYPVLADSYRALGRHSRVDELWLELREQSPSSELVNEGRIVAAGSLADQGRLADAIRLLEKGWKAPKRPKDVHLRRAYALADLLERAGSVPRARQLFAWLSNVAPGFADVDARLSALG